MALVTDAAVCDFAILMTGLLARFSSENHARIRTSQKMVKVWIGGLSVALKSIHVTAEVELEEQSSPKPLEVSLFRQTLQLLGLRPMVI